ncbi:MAG TPA: efflux transporter outer membrane subunit [Planctomycetota bacterium]|nr:efflux transporter outer membrane subunit [Planctomycetota bacterium]
MAPVARITTARAVLLAGALLAGCAQAPPFDPPAPPVEAPPTWASGPTPPGAPRPDWWKTFGDPRLEALIEEGVRRSFSLRAAAARVEAALALARIAGADRLPQASLGAQAARQKQVFVGLEIPGFDDVLASRSSVYAFSLDLSWEIDLWGRVRSAQAAALADVQAQEADFEGARLSLEGQVARAYFAAVESRLQAALARRTLESYRATTARIEERFRLGLRPALDVALARTAETGAESALRLREEEHALAARRLEALVARYPRGAVETAESLPPLPDPPPAGLPSELVTRRPDLAAAERRLAAAGLRVEEARAALYPRLSLTGSAGQTSSELRDLLDGDFSVWRIGANLLQPLFQGGRLRAGVELARSRTEEALALYAAQALRAFEEVESALAAEQALARREEALRKGLADARAALDQAERRYLAGLTDLLTLQESQRRLYDIESQILAVVRRRLDTRVQLHLALGGGFSWPRG